MDNATFLLLLGLILGFSLAMLLSIVYHRLFARFFGREEVRKLQSEVKALEGRLREKDKLIIKYIKEAKKRLPPEELKRLEALEKQQGGQK